MSPFLPPHQQYDFAPIGSPHLSIRTDDVECGASVENDYWTTYYNNHCYSPVPQYYGPFHDAIVHHVDPAAAINTGLDWGQGERYQSWPNGKVTPYIDTNSVDQHRRHHHSLEHRFSDEDAFAMASLRASATAGMEGNYENSHTPDPSLGLRLEEEKEDSYATPQHHLPTKRNLRKRISLTPLESVGVRKRISPTTGTGKGKSAGRQQAEAAGKSTAVATPSTPSPTVLPDRFSACIPCRRRKIKCVPRGDSHAYHRNGSNDGVCATCIRRRKDCFWPKLNMSGSTSQEVRSTPVAPSSSSPSFSSTSSSSSLSAPSSSLSPVKSRPPHRLATTRDYSSADEEDNDEEEEEEEEEAERRAASPSLRTLPSTTMTMIKEEEERPVALQESHLPSVVESHFGLPKYAFGRSISSTSLSSSSSTPRHLSPSPATTSTISTSSSSLHLLPSSSASSSSSFSLSTPLSPLPPLSPAWPSLHFLTRELTDAHNTLEAHYDDNDDDDDNINNNNNNEDNSAGIGARYPLVSSPSMDMTLSLGLGLEEHLHSHSPPPFFPAPLSLRE